jgi:hypothetical protein
MFGYISEEDLRSMQPAQQQQPVQPVQPIQPRGAS